MLDARNKRRFAISVFRNRRMFGAQNRLHVLTAVTIVFLGWMDYVLTLPMTGIITHSISVEITEDIYSTTARKINGSSIITKQSAVEPEEDYDNAITGYDYILIGGETNGSVSSTDTMVYCNASDLVCVGEFCKKSLTTCHMPASPGKSYLYRAHMNRA